MSMHAELLEELKQEATKIRLVASLHDDRLAFGNANDMRVFIPDMHAVTKKTRTKYSYDTNDTLLLARILARLADMKTRGTDRTVGVFQVGDFLDLWREEPLPTVRKDAPARIIDDHRDLMTAFFDPRLKSRFLLGNHDVDLAWWPNFMAWERRYFLAPRTSHTPTGMVLHGDLFDWVEMFPDGLNEFFVYFFSPHRSAADHDLKAVRDVIYGKNEKLDFSEKISGTASHAGLRATDGSFDTHNVREHEFLGKAARTARKANDLFKLDLRFMVIGHTHHARIAVQDDADGFFALIDCGGWIENAEDDSGETYPNQTLAVIAENEARIYQLTR